MAKAVVVRAALRARMRRMAERNLRMTATSPTSARRSGDQHNDGGKADDGQ